MISVVAFALVLIVFFLVPSIRNDLFRLSEMKEGEDLINLTHGKSEGIEVVDANEAMKMGEGEIGANRVGEGGGGGGGDGLLKTFRTKKGPPKEIKVDRRFHFAPEGKVGIKDYEAISLKSNKSLEFHGPSNARQVRLRWNL